MSTHETCRAASRNAINWIQSHLVGQSLNSIHDARTHVYKMRISNLNGDKYCIRLIVINTTINIRSCRRNIDMITPVVACVINS